MARVSLVNSEVGPIGYGMMGLTWERANPNLPSREQAFAAMDAALETGANFFNGGDVYGTAERNSTHLIREYLEKNPDEASKIVLSIKGGVVHGTFNIDGSEAGVRRTVEDSIKGLGGVKQIDIFEYARVDPNIPIEETMTYLKSYRDQGKIGGVGLSEVRASTIERAHKITPIAAVEVELSLWSLDILRNGVAETCARLQIPIVAYSPLSRGALTGTITKFEDLAENDSRRHFPKFQADVLDRNLKLNEEVEQLAKRKGCPQSQIAINWVRALSNRKVKVYDAQGEQKEVTLPVVIPIPGSTKPARVAENSTVVDLTDAEMDELMNILERNPTTGERYPAALASAIEG